MREFVTILTASQPVNKTVTLQAGEPTKAMVRAPSLLKAETRHVPSAEPFVAILNEIGADPCKCLSLGFIPGTEEGQPFNVVSKRRLGQMLNLPNEEPPPDDLVEINGEQYCTRTKKNFTQGVWALFDKDTAPGQPDELITDDTDEWLEWMSKLVPGFGDAEKVIVPSTSSRVNLNGVQLFEGGGLHCYVRLSDPEDVPRFKQELLISAMSGCYGFQKPSFNKLTGEIVSSQAWTICDVSVFSPERLVFDGAPVVQGDGLTVAPLTVDVVKSGGGELDTGLLRATESELDKVAKVTGLKVKRDTVNGVRVPVFVDDKSLRLDTEIDTEAGVMSIEQYCLSGHQHLRCQAVFRPESVSQAAFVNRHSDGTPFFFDTGSGVKYVLPEDQHSNLIGLQIKQLTELSEEAAVNTVLEMMKPLSPVARDRYIKEVKAATGIGIGALRSQLQSVSVAGTGLSDVVDLGERAARLALRLHYSNGDHLTIGAGGEFFEYTGTHWVRVSKDRVSHSVMNAVVQFGLNDGSAPVSSIVSSAISLLRSLQCKVDDPFSLTSEPLPVINAQNGELWIDERGGVELRPHKPESYQLQVLGCKYDPAAKAPMLERALSEIFDYNQRTEGMMRHLLELVGYVVQPTRNIATIAIFQGEGNDGKTTVSRLIETLLGGDGTYSIEMAKMGGSQNDIGPLCGKRLLLDDDLDTGHALPDGLLKKYSERKLLSGSYKHGQVFNFVNRAVPLLLCNNPPRLKDMSKGLRRRLQVFPFQRSFSEHEADTGLFDRIIQRELSGILNLALAGAKRVLQRGRFDPPRECMEALSELLIAANPLPAFIDDSGGWDGIHQEVAAHGYLYGAAADAEWLTLKHVFNRFNAWCRENTPNYRPTLQAMRSNLKGMGFLLAKKNNQWVWLKPEEEACGLTGDCWKCAFGSVQKGGWSIEPLLVEVAGVLPWVNVACPRRLGEAGSLLTLAD